MFDIVIRKGLIVDGEGKKAYQADIGIQGERIKEIGNLTSFSSQKYIEAEGLTVAPGMIGSSFFWTAAPQRFDTSSCLIILDFTSIDEFCQVFKREKN